MTQRRYLADPPALPAIRYKNRITHDQPVVKNEDVAKALRAQLAQERAAMRERLRNWGRWYRRDNVAVIDRATGMLSLHPIAANMDQAPHRDKTGYYTDPTTPADEPDALLVNDALALVTDEQMRVIVLRYVSMLGMAGLAAYLGCSERTAERLEQAAVDAVIAGFDLV